MSVYKNISMAEQSGGCGECNFRGASTSVHVRGLMQRWRPGLALPHGTDRRWSRGLGGKV